MKRSWAWNTVAGVVCWLAFVGVFLGPGWRVTLVSGSPSASSWDLEQALVNDAEAHEAMMAAPELLGTSPTFPFFPEWSALVNVQAKIYGANGEVIFIEDAAAQIYSSFPTFKHAIVFDPQLYQYHYPISCPGLGAVVLTTNQVESSWGTSNARLVYNASECYWVDYASSLNSLSFFSWFACNIRAFAFETVECSNYLSNNPISPTYLGRGLYTPLGHEYPISCDHWQWEFPENNEEHNLYIWPGTPTRILGYVWWGTDQQGCQFNETLDFQKFTLGAPDTRWFQAPPTGLSSCAPFPFNSLDGYCSLLGCTI